MLYSFNHSVQRTTLGDAPIAVHATYLPDLHLFALWSPDDASAESRSTVRLTVPAADGHHLEVREIACELVDAESLIGRPAQTASMRVWVDALASGTVPGVMPPAAHAVPNQLGTSMTSADYVRRVFADTKTLERGLADTVHATLRPYQARGISWLSATADVEGGAVLADEMGLGKTVQAIGLLVVRVHGPALVVCPKSLVSNWLREIRRFAPTLDARGWSPHDPQESSAASGSVTVVTYSTLRNHAEMLRRITWETVVFDEAQALKNPRTQVSRAARGLNSRARIALTGTPVENHLDELWSLLNLVAASRFAHRAVYRRRFTVPATAGDSDALTRLRAATAPVMLRRSKADVASSLPPKIDNPVLCDLSGEQTEMYDRVLAETVDAGFGSGVARHGKVLAALTRLKQLCNHPGLIDGNVVDLAGRSGKLDACTDVLASNLESGSATLVFTQYRATGDLLRRHLVEQFGVDAPFFHGGLTAADRDDLVDRFQRGLTEPIMVMSLKAGGIGLTLTHASEVIHFDRWWNPAVEAQASDRVHRIGQQKTVTITTLTTATTIEEHIAAMHDRKSTVSSHAADASVVAELARLPDERLLEVLTRSRGIA